MNKSKILDEFLQQYRIAGVIDLDSVDYNSVTYPFWLEEQLKAIRKECYEDNERIVIFIDQDYYETRSNLGLKLQSLQKKLNEVDISNYFCLIVSSNPELSAQIEELKKISSDPIEVKMLEVTHTTFKKINMDKQKNKTYQYASPDLIKMDMQKLSDRQRYLLTESDRFCMYPWVHLHAYPNGEAWPCCGTNREPGPVGNCKKNTLKEIWNSDKMKLLRKDMLSETWNSYCIKCYEQEDSGFFSMRNSANKHLGHHINKVNHTQEDGSLEEFEMVHWDIRFSNLCNLSCRSCGYIFSSKWHADQVKLLGEWAPKFIQENPVLNYAGRTETDMWEQLIPHLDYVEQIYFAGGEPLMMEEHYLILEELERRGRFDVRLIYNTNFTHVKLKERWVFDYWKKFDSVAVGASLDAMGPRGEYIRKGTDWDMVERNRQLMLETCPDVDFYISPTLSILNAWHLPDFHRNWVERGFIRAQDLNVNILQDPAHYRIDIAPTKYKQRLRVKFEEHLEWLRPLDTLQRATVGFESAMHFMMDTDNSFLIEKFWEKTQQLDSIRTENALTALPELEALVR